VRAQAAYARRVHATRFDDDGWAIGAVAPLPANEAYSLWSPHADARVDEAALSHVASRFFGAQLALARPKRYPTGALPLADVAELAVTLPRAEESTRVSVVTVPASRALEARRAAEAAVRAIGGAGFDALLARAVRLWQVEARVASDALEGGDARAPLLVAAILASAWLAPIVPPDASAIYGVKGARERLHALGVGV
jgi:hypothetical protein